MDVDVSADVGIDTHVWMQMFIAMQTDIDAGAGVDIQTEVHRDRDTGTEIGVDTHAACSSLARHSLGLGGITRW